MHPRTISLLAVPALLTGCADLVTPVAHSTHVVAAVVRVSVEQRDVHGAAAASDAISFVRITGPATDVRRALEADGRTEVRLSASGSFIASSWSRTCGRTCDTLRPAEHRCERRFTATLGEATDLEVRFSRAGTCDIAVGA
jgi:hypothetical protein